MAGDLVLTGASKFDDRTLIGDDSKINQIARWGWEMSGLPFRLPFHRVPHDRQAGALLEKGSATDPDAAIALGWLSFERLQSGLKKKRPYVLSCLQRAATTSDAASMRRLSIYMTFINGEWTREAVQIVYQAYELGDSMAGFILAKLLGASGDCMLNAISLSGADRESLYVSFLEVSAQRGCVEAGAHVGYYCMNHGETEKAVQWLVWAAERGYVDASENLSSWCPLNGKALCIDDGDAFVSHVMRLAVEFGDFDASYWISRYLAARPHDGDLTASIRFYRRSLSNEPEWSEILLFGERLWDQAESWGVPDLLILLREDRSSVPTNFHLIIRDIEEIGTVPSERILPLICPPSQFFGGKEFGKECTDV